MEMEEGVRSGEDCQESLVFCPLSMFQQGYLAARHPGLTLHSLAFRGCKMQYLQYKAVEWNTEG